MIGGVFRGREETSVFPKEKYLVSIWNRDAEKCEDIPFSLVVQDNAWKLKDDEGTIYESVDALVSARSLNLEERIDQFDARVDRYNKAVLSIEKEGFFLEDLYKDAPCYMGAKRRNYFETQVQWADKLEDYTLPDVHAVFFDTSTNQYTLAQYLRHPDEGQASLRFYRISIDASKDPSDLLLQDSEGKNTLCRGLSLSNFVEKRSPISGLPWSGEVQKLNTAIEQARKKASVVKTTRRSKPSSVPPAISNRAKDQPMPAETKEEGVASLYPNLGHSETAQEAIVRPDWMELSMAHFSNSLGRTQNNRFGRFTGLVNGLEREKRTLEDVDSNFHLLIEGLSLLPSKSSSIKEKGYSERLMKYLRSDKVSLVDLVHLCELAASDKVTTRKEKEQVRKNLETIFKEKVLRASDLVKESVKAYLSQLPEDAIEDVKSLYERLSKLL